MTLPHARLDNSTTGASGPKKADESREGSSAEAAAAGDSICVSVVSTKVRPIRTRSKRQWYSSVDIRSLQHRQLTDPMCSYCCRVKQLKKLKWFLSSRSSAGNTTTPGPDIEQATPREIIIFSKLSSSRLQASTTCSCKVLALLRSESTKQKMKSDLRVQHNNIHQHHL